MDWFERLTGFREQDYEQTRNQLEVEGRQLRSKVNGHGYGIGDLEIVALRTLRERVKAGGGLPGRLKARVEVGDVRRMHVLPENAGALFQVASQFNLLEMVSPGVTPEDGVTRYERDRTQGPACAVAAGAATIYRNYFVPVGGGHGQTQERQVDGLAELGTTLAAALGRPVEALWEMRNGYALCSQSGLDAIAGHLTTLPPDRLDAVRGKLCIGVHSDVEVTAGVHSPRPVVSQAFCSALPVAYSDVPSTHWKAFATLVLEGAYEATLLAAASTAQTGGSNVVLLTSLGGGAFGNEEAWIHAAMRRALRAAAGMELDVRVVSFRDPSPQLLKLIEEFA